MPASGHCKICASPYAVAVNKLLSEGKNSTEVTKAMEPFPISFTRKTLGEHKKHITSPLQTLVEKAQAKPVIKPTSNRAVLEAIRDLGMQRAMDNPGEVTIDHALKAAAELQKAETKGETVQILLAKVVMQELAPDVKGYIEGEYKELEGGSDESIDAG